MRITKVIVETKGGGADLQCRMQKFGANGHRFKKVSLFTLTVSENVHCQCHLNVLQILIGSYVTAEAEGNLPNEDFLYLCQL